MRHTLRPWLTTALLGSLLVGVAQPRQARADFNQGLILLQQKYYDEAAAEFEKEVKKNKDLDKAWYYLGLSYQKSKKYEDAARAFRTLVELQPAVYENWALLGKAYFGGEKWNESAMAFQTALSHATEDKEKYEANAFMGQALYRNQRFQAAAAALSEANKIKPNLELTILIGDVSFKGEDWKGAAAAYELALGTKVDDPDLLKKVTYSLAKQASIPLNPPDAEASKVLWSKVADWANKAVIANPGDADLANLRASATTLSGRGEEAIASYTQAIPLNPDDCTLQQDLGVIYYNAAKFDEAEQTLLGTVACTQRLLNPQAAPVVVDPAAGGVPTPPGGSAPVPAAPAAPAATTTPAAPPAAPATPAAGTTTVVTTSGPEGATAVVSTTEAGAANATVTTTTPATPVNSIVRPSTAGPLTEKQLKDTQAAAYLYLGYINKDKADATQALAETEVPTNIETFKLALTLHQKAIDYLRQSNEVVKSDPVGQLITDSEESMKLCQENITAIEAAMEAAKPQKGKKK